MEQKKPKKELKTTKKGGRKRINIDLEQVENLASRGLGTTQIARALGVSWNTIDRNRKRSGDFEEAYKRVVFYKESLLWHIFIKVYICSPDECVCQL